MPLSDFSIKNAKAKPKPYKLSDFDGLYLYVTPQGSRLWRYDYRFAGKRKTASFGVYPGISLIAAREARETARKLLKDGRDPMGVRQSDKARINGSAENSFEKLARSWFEARKARWTPTHAEAISRHLEAFVFPDLGRRPINEIEPPELLAVIRKIEKKPAPTTARKVLQSCGQVFRFAIAEGKAVRDPSRDLVGALTAGPPVKHRAALSASELPSFLYRLDSSGLEEQLRLALEIMLLCLTRAVETCAAQWSEFEGLNGTAPIWRVPASRTKMKRQHLIPLAPRAVGILGRLKELAGPSRYVFPSPGKTGCITRQALLDTMYKLGYKGEATIHGFRRTGSTILHEKGFHPDWIELALAHRISGVRGVYNAALCIEDRRKMMNWWAEYLEGCREVGALAG